MTWFYSNKLILCTYNLRLWEIYERVGGDNFKSRSLSKRVNPRAFPQRVLAKLENNFTFTALQNQTSKSAKWDQRENDRKTRFLGVEILPDGSGQKSGVLALGTFSRKD